MMTLYIINTYTLALVPAVILFGHKYCIVSTSRIVVFDSHPPMKVVFYQGRWSVRESQVQQLDL